MGCCKTNNRYLRTIYRSINQRHLLQYLPGSHNSYQVLTHFQRRSSTDFGSHCNQGTVLVMVNIEQSSISAICACRWKYIQDLYLAGTTKSYFSKHLFRKRQQTIFHYFEISLLILLSLHKNHLRNPIQRNRSLKYHFIIATYFP